MPADIRQLEADIPSLPAPRMQSIIKRLSALLRVLRHSQEHPSLTSSCRKPPFASDSSDALHAALWRLHGNPLTVHRRDPAGLRFAVGFGPVRCSDKGRPGEGRLKQAPRNACSGAIVSISVCGLESVGDLLVQDRVCSFIVSCVASLGEFGVVGGVVPL